MNMTAARKNMLAIIRGEMSNHPHDYARGWLARDYLTATPPDSDAQVAVLREAIGDWLKGPPTHEWTQWDEALANAYRDTEAAAKAYRDEVEKPWRDALKQAAQSKPNVRGIAAFLTSGPFGAGSLQHRERTARGGGDVSRFVCAFWTFYWTLIKGGYWRGFRVSGHEYGEPVYTVIDKKVWDEVPTEQYVRKVELETLVCQRCGDTDEAWRPMP